jgi:hypothetical protein
MAMPVQLARAKRRRSRNSDRAFAIHQYQRSAATYFTAITAPISIPIRSATRSCDTEASKSSTTPTGARSSAFNGFPPISARLVLYSYVAAAAAGRIGYLTEMARCLPLLPPGAVRLTEIQSGRPQMPRRMQTALTTQRPARRQDVSTHPQPNPKARSQNQRTTVQ